MPDPAVLAQASFVRSAAGVHEIRDYLRECLQEAAAADPSRVDEPLPLIISKIESTEALEELPAIISASDGIMVARGDLGVEVPIEHIATYQKDIVEMCTAAGKPVVVATQMLESMQKNPRPTRAEVIATLIARTPCPHRVGAHHFSGRSAAWQLRRCHNELRAVRAQGGPLRNLAGGRRDERSAGGRRCGDALWRVGQWPVPS